MSAEGSHSIYYSPYKLAMLAEVNLAKDYLIGKFGVPARVPVGKHAVPTQTSRGDAFMCVEVNVDGFMSNFKLFWDEELTQCWYTREKDGSPRKM